MGQPAQLLNSLIKDHMRCLTSEQHVDYLDTEDRVGLKFCLKMVLKSLSLGQTCRHPENAI